VIIPVLDSYLEWTALDDSTRVCPEMPFRRKLSLILFLAPLVTWCGSASRRNNLGQASPSTSANLKPDSAKTDQGVYTNYFFGMTYRYPSDWKIQPPLPQKAGGKKIYVLLFLTLPAKQIEFTALSVTAREASTPIETAEEYLSNENLSTDVSPLRAPQQVLMGETRFLRFDAEQKSKSGTTRIAEFVSIQKGYVLEFLFVDGAKKSRISEFDRTLQTIQFSEP
jgi:hypothetical protein